ncbi:hypothetical protein PRK78_006469 [Emydomyces testavorans]|uniref:BZIP domain-containing protein n=1 Tax=Emydomyces testavorans TaxID=2070801 RepID=A0AAF0DQA1_9EURO|nr:hypothetical protein PRK78_006469 [Emydomyces testavorans]
MSGVNGETLFRDYLVPSNQRSEDLTANHSGSSQNADISGSVQIPNGFYSVEQFPLGTPESSNSPLRYVDPQQLVQQFQPAGQDLTPALTMGDNMANSRAEVGQTSPNKRRQRSSSTDSKLEVKRAKNRVSAAKAREKKRVEEEARKEMVEDLQRAMRFFRSCMDAHGERCKCPLTMSIKEFFQKQGEAQFRKALEEIHGEKI